MFIFVLCTWSNKTNTYENDFVETDSFTKKETKKENMKTLA